MLTRMSLATFAESARRGRVDPRAILARVSSEPPSIGSNSRTATYTFSTSAVVRDNHRIPAEAWQTANFMKNPVFLWAHDTSMLPIGRVTDVYTIGGALKGTVEYLTADKNPFADSVFELVRSGFLNAVSVSWTALEWHFATDRPGGVDFDRVDLLEVSQVPLPADPAALVEARRLGIDTAPLAQWCMRTLDRPGPVPIPRLRLQALARAAGALAPRPRPVTKADRERRAREVVEIGRRQERADAVLARIKAEDAPSPPYRPGGDLSTPEARLVHALRVIAKGASWWEQD